MISITLHWWYIPIALFLAAGFFFLRMGRSNSFGIGIIDLMLCGACVLAAVISLIVGWIA